MLLAPPHCTRMHEGTRGMAPILLPPPRAVPFCRAPPPLTQATRPGACMAHPPAPSSRPAARLGAEAPSGTAWPGGSTPLPAPPLPATRPGACRSHAWRTRRHPRRVQQHDGVRPPELPRVGGVEAAQARAPAPAVGPGEGRTGFKGSGGQVLGFRGPDFRVKGARFKGVGGQVLGFRGPEKSALAGWRATGAGCGRATEEGEGLCDETSSLPPPAL
jgi:hypothetical protein